MLTHWNYFYHYSLNLINAVLPHEKIPSLKIAPIYCHTTTSISNTIMTDANKLLLLVIEEERNCPQKRWTEPISAEWQPGFIHHGNEGDSNN